MECARICKSLDPSMRRTGCLACILKTSLGVSSPDTSRPESLLGDGVNGVEVARRILQEKPGTKVLLMSGYLEKEVLAAEKLPFLRNRSPTPS